MIQEHSQNAQAIRFSTDQLPQVIASRMQPLADLLNQPNIDMKQLKRLMSRGISDEAETLREYAWKLVLGYLPTQRDRWSHAIEHQRQLYGKFLGEFMGEEEFEGWPLPMDKHHPLWLKHQANYTLWEQIQKDTCRTQAELALFCRPAPPILLPYLTPTRREKQKHIRGIQSFIDQQPQHQTYYYDYLTRILFIFAKMHPKVSYVQGMNELVAPLFYLLNGTKRGQQVQQTACFFMFNNIMSDVVELHMVDYHTHQDGIYGRLDTISTMLLAIDPPTWHSLHRMRIEPVFYAFRWVTLLFSQEFALHETFRIWESILGSESSRVGYTNFMVIAMLVASREVIGQQDYGATMSYFKQISRHVSVEKAIELADKMEEEHRWSDMKAMATKNRNMNREGAIQNEPVSVRKRISALFRRIIG